MGHSEVEKRRRSEREITEALRTALKEIGADSVHRRSSRDLEADPWADISGRLNQRRYGFEVKVASDVTAMTVSVASTRASRIRRATAVQESSAILVLSFDGDLGTNGHNEPRSFLKSLVRRATGKGGFDAVLIALDVGRGPVMVGVRSPDVSLREASRLSDAILLADQLLADSHRPWLYKEPSRTATRRPIGLPLRYLLVADEWAPAKGGISSFNLDFAKALRRAGDQVCIAVPAVSTEELSRATELGIEVAIPRQSLPGVEGAAALLPGIKYLGDRHFVPDVIVGHGRVLGPYAYALQSSLRSSPLRLHVVHTDPEQLELAKEVDGGEPRTREAAARRRLELELAGSADLVAGVGPLLSGWIQDELSARDTPPGVITILPGLREWARLRDPSLIQNRRVFVFVGRAEDYTSKGLNLAISALGKAKAQRPGLQVEIKLVIRGVPHDHRLLRAKVNEDASQYGLTVLFREYTTDEEDIANDLLTASAAVMPSIHEGFGLAAYEAIAIGTPALYSRASGLSMMLKEFQLTGIISPHDGALPVGTPASEEAWTNAIGDIIDDPQPALEQSRILRREIAALDLWSRSVAELDSRVRSLLAQRDSREHMR